MYGYIHIYFIFIYVCTSHRYRFIGAGFVMGYSWGHEMITCKTWSPGAPIAKLLNRTCFARVHVGYATVMAMSISELTGYFNGIIHSIWGFLSTYNL